MQGSYNLITEKIDLQTDTQNRFRTLKYNEGKVPGLIPAAVSPIPVQ